MIYYKYVPVVITFFLKKKTPIITTYYVAYKDFQTDQTRIRVIRAYRVKLFEMCNIFGNVSTRLFRYFFLPEI